MEKGNYLKLDDICDLLLKAVERYLFRKNEDPCVDITINSEPLQKLINLLLPQDDSLRIKLFPHRNYAEELVYRIEVYRTKSGDLRGNKIAFIEASSHEGAIDEIHRFVQSFLAQLGF